MFNAMFNVIRSTPRVSLLLNCKSCLPYDLFLYKIVNYGLKIRCWLHCNKSVFLIVSVIKLAQWVSISRLKDLPIGIEMLIFFSSFFISINNMVDIYGQRCYKTKRFTYENILRIFLKKILVILFFCFLIWFQLPIYKNNLQILYEISEIFSNFSYSKQIILFYIQNVNNFFFRIKRKQNRILHRKIIFFCYIFLKAFLLYIHSFALVIIL